MIPYAFDYANINSVLKMNFLLNINTYVQASKTLRENPKNLSNLIPDETERL